MGEILDRLWSVQQLQNELTDTRRQREAEFERLTGRARKIDELRRTVALKREESLRKAAEMKTCELDSKAKGEQIAALRVKLNMCRNQKEYAALLSEIASAETATAQLDERYLKLDEETKNLKTALTAVEQQLKAEEEAHLKTEAAARARIVAMDKKLAELDGRRKASLAEVKADVRQAFERLASRFEGQAMVIIEPAGDDGDFACSSCNMTLTAGTVSAVINTDEVRTCPTCTRMLYYQG
jgi:predicted  nucleic acid-binding Zn-ribbon protein